MSVTTDKRGRRHLKPLADFLKPANGRAALRDDGAAVAEFLDRKIAKQERRSLQERAERSAAPQPSRARREDEGP